MTISKLMGVQEPGTDECSGPISLWPADCAHDSCRLCKVPSYRHRLSFDSDLYFLCDKVDFKSKVTERTALWYTRTCSHCNLNLILIFIEVMFYVVSYRIAKQPHRIGRYRYHDYENCPFRQKIESYPFQFHLLRNCNNVEVYS